MVDRSEMKVGTKRAMAKDPDFDDLSAHNIHGRWAALLAESLGSVVEITSDSADTVNLAVVLPGPLD